MHNSVLFNFHIRERLNEHAERQVRDESDGVCQTARCVACLAEAKKNDRACPSDNYTTGSKAPARRSSKHMKRHCR